MQFNYRFANKTFPAYLKMLVKKSVSLLHASKHYAKRCGDIRLKYDQMISFMYGNQNEGQKEISNEWMFRVVEIIKWKHSKLLSLHFTFQNKNSVTFRSLDCLLLLAKLTDSSELSGFCVLSARVGNNAVEKKWLWYTIRCRRAGVIQNQTVLFLSSLLRTIAVDCINPLSRQHATDTALYLHFPATAS